MEEHSVLDRRGSLAIKFMAAVILLIAFGPCTVINLFSSSQPSTLNPQPTQAVLFSVP